jgi:hypothetical protein
MKPALLQWLSRIADDARIPDYGFRLALRLASKVHNEKLQTRIRKLRPTADSDAIVALIDAGFLCEVEGPSPKQTFFQIVTSSTEVLK